MKFTITLTLIVPSLNWGLQRSWNSYGFRNSMYASGPLGSRLPPDGRPPAYNEWRLWNRFEILRQRNYFCIRLGCSVVLFCSSWWALKNSQWKNDRGHPVVPQLSFFGSFGCGRSLLLHRLASWLSRHQRQKANIGARENGLRHGPKCRKCRLPCFRPAETYEAVLYLGKNLTSEHDGR